MRTGQAFVAGVVRSERKDRSLLALCRAATLVAFSFDVNTSKAADLQPVKRMLQCELHELSKKQLNIALDYFKPIVHFQKKENSEESASVTPWMHAFPYLEVYGKPALRTRISLDPKRSVEVMTAFAGNQIDSLKSSIRLNHEGRIVFINVPITTSGIGSDLGNTSHKVKSEPILLKNKKGDAMKLTVLITHFADSDTSVLSCTHEAIRSRE